jgi:hypothetical protein
MFEELKRMAGERLQMHEFEAAVDYFLKCIDMMDVTVSLVSSAKIY